MEYIAIHLHALHSFTEAEDSGSSSSSSSSVGAIVGAAVGVVLVALVLIITVVLVVAWVRSRKSHTKEVEDARQSVEVQKKERRQIDRYVGSE